MKILFVCSSNVCRSPYCEFMMKKIVNESDILRNAGIEISSSAVFNKSREIFPKAVVSLEKEGFDENEVKKFKPTYKREAEDSFKEADIIIGMSKIHKLLTPKKYRAKFVTLSEAAINTYIKIPDPFLAKSQEEYDAVMAVIKEYLYILSEDLEKRFTNRFS